MAGIGKQIIGSFEDIGKDIVREVTNVPKDIAGNALESLGTTSGKQQKNPSPTTTQKPPEAGPVSELDRTKDQKMREAIARAALEQFAGKPKPKEPSVWDRREQEDKEKKDQAAQQAAAQKLAAPVATSSKRPKGDLYGMKAKKASAEMSRNVRQD